MIMPAFPEDHFQRLARLLDLEAEAEAEQARSQMAGVSAPELERRGIGLVDLVLIEETGGLGGRCLLTFAKRNRTVSLPWSRLQVGSPVLVLPEIGSADAGPRGVVCERNAQRICVAVPEPL